MDSRTLLSSLPSLSLSLRVRLASQSDGSPSSSQLLHHVLSPGVSLIKQSVFNPILPLLLRDPGYCAMYLSWSIEGPRPDGEGHLLRVPGFQTDTENL